MCLVLGLCPVLLVPLFFLFPFASSMQVIEDRVHDELAAFECPLLLGRALADGIMLCRLINLVYTKKAVAIVEDPGKAPSQSLRLPRNADAFVTRCKALGISAIANVLPEDIVNATATPFLVSVLEDVIFSTSESIV